MQRCLELGLILTRARPFLPVAALVCVVAMTHRHVGAADDLGARRAELDARFHDHLEALARRCDELEMDDAARTTRQWFVQRDPNRRYVFLIPDRDQTAPSPCWDVGNSQFPSVVTSRDPPFSRSITATLPAFQLM